jgi:excisionase family DNA binding protein
MEDEILTTTELCSWLKVGRSTVLNWRNRGMPYIGQGKSMRYQKSKVIAWLEKQRENVKK